MDRCKVVLIRDIAEDTKPFSRFVFFNPILFLHMHLTNSSASHTAGHTDLLISWH